MQSCDVLVVGGGMAGVSIASELATDRRVVLLDMEATLAFHTTGRSAAMFLETYGGPSIRALTAASRTFFEREPLLSPMPMMSIGRPGRSAAVRALHREVSTHVPDARLLDPDEAVARQPMLRRDQLELAMLEPGAMAIDVHALHQLFLHALRRRGGDAVISAAIVAARLDSGGGWTVVDAAGRSWQAPVIVNASGAWADRVARFFGARPVGLRPLRRTAFMVDAPPGMGPPMVNDIDEDYYVKPDAGRLLCSPADETPQEPGDARPDELEIARAIEAINSATTLDVRHVRSAWAGLRTFAADRTPVVGYDPSVAGLFWFAGQGGYGIQTAPALACCGAALVRGEPLPPDVLARGLAAPDLAADRPGLAVTLT